MKVKILWASPLPPIRSGVSDYSVEILRPLSRLADVKILSPPGCGAPLELPADLAALLVPFETVPDPGQLLVAHFGNNPYHQWIVDKCRGCRQAVGVVHDLVLHHLLVNHSLVINSDPGAFGRSMTEAHGNAGKGLADAREYGLTGHLDPFLFPALKAVLGDMAALICHSEFALNLLKTDLADIPIFKMKLPCADPGQVDRMVVRRRLGIADGDLLMMHLGFLTPEKGLAPVLTGLAAVRAEGIDARLLLVGEQSGDSNLMAVAKSLGIESAVESTGWLPWGEMIAVPAAADIGVALRVPSAGETSAAVLRFLACGTPTAVVARRQFLEWPRQVAPRITPGPSMSADIRRLLENISRDQDWSLRRPAARKVYEDGHTPEQAAAHMVEFLSRIV